jgi:hypothetical protein
MSDSKDPKKSAYEVGYGKPPKERQFKPKSQSMHNSGSKQAKGRKRTKGTTEKVNLAALLSEPVRVRKHEQVHKMDPFDVILRKQVEQAVKQRSQSAFKNIFDLAIKYELVAIPPPVRSGGVLSVALVTMEDLEFWLNYRDKSEAGFKAMLRKPR